MEGIHYKGILGSIEKLLKIVDGIHRQFFWDGEAFDRDCLEIISTDQTVTEVLGRIFKEAGAGATVFQRGAKYGVQLSRFKSLEAESIQKVQDELIRAREETGLRVLGEIIGLSVPSQSPDAVKGLIDKLASEKGIGQNQAGKTP